MATALNSELNFSMFKSGLKLNRVGVALTPAFGKLCKFSNGNLVFFSAKNIVPVSLRACKAVFRVGFQESPFPQSMQVMMM